MRIFALHRLIKKTITIIIIWTAAIVLCAAVSYETHKVKKGDTLYSLSKKYGVSVQAIRELNGMSDNRLSIGQVLKIKPKQEAVKPTPKPVAPPPAVPPGQTAATTPKPSSVADTTAVSLSELPDEYFHVVKPKENLYRIAVNSDITFKDILRYNNLTEDQTSIQPGQRLLIKDPATYIRPAATTTAPPTEQSRTPDLVITAPVDPDSIIIEKVYIVQRKDTLFKIARENEMTVEELKKINNLTSNSIHPGQKLYIVPPRGGVVTSTPAKPLREADLKTKDIIRTDLILPVDGNVISEYGIRNGRPHKGIDIGAASGMPVYAVLDGIVVFAGIQGNYGNVVVIEHPDFVMTVYAHNEKNLVSVGDVVKQGQVIATVGSTGNATCSHVHFEYRVKGKAINPRKVLPLGK